MIKSQELSAELIEEFIRAAHDNLDRVKELLQAHPNLLNVKDEEGDETPIGAAAHSGEREIVTYLLNEGAPLDICTAAMLGLHDEVAVEMEYEDIAEVLRNYIGVDNLETCLECGLKCYRIVQRLEGSRYRGSFTTYYICKACGGSMGYRNNEGL